MGKNKQRIQQGILFILIGLIKCYGFLLRPFLGYRCRFYPCCSSYAVEALSRHGICQGTWLTLKRLLRCHPWHEGGFDPVPPNIK